MTPPLLAPPRARTRDSLFPGKCACYPGFACSLDCTCSNCAPHRYVTERRSR